MDFIVESYIVNENDENETIKHYKGTDLSEADIAYKKAAIQRYSGKTATLFLKSAGKIHRSYRLDKNYPDPRSREKIYEEWSNINPEDDIKLTRSEAAQILMVSETRVSHWLNGRKYTRNGVKKHDDPIFIQGIDWDYSGKGGTIQINLSAIDKFIKGDK